MSEKIFVPHNEEEPPSQIGATLEALAASIARRRDADEKSYTYRLLTGNEDELLKKLSEEVSEVLLAAKDVQALSSALNSEDIYDEQIDHLRYEAADVIYHLMVVLERHQIPVEELAAELNMRMEEHERPHGSVRLNEKNVKRGK